MNTLIRSAFAYCLERAHRSRAAAAAAILLALTFAPTLMRRRPASGRIIAGELRRVNDERKSQ